MYGASLTRIDEVLEKLDARFDLAELDGQASAIAAVSVEGTILWVNSAWRDFGAANGAAPATIAPGTRYVDGINGELRAWFACKVARCTASGVVFENDYECSSATEKRTFRMRMLPIPQTGLLITHSLRFAEPHLEVDVGPAKSCFRAKNGFIVMCSNCRHIRRVDHSAWDWVPAWVAEPPDRVSHGLCPLCAGYYYL